MNGAGIELVIGPIRRSLRSLLGWGVGLASLVAVTVAFWPAFRGSSGISEAIDQLPAGVVDAFGLAGFGTPAGFLRGNLYEFVVPLLMSVAAVAMANALTAGDEDAGRLETYVTQPVSRAAVIIGRALALVVWLAGMTVIVLVVQYISDLAVGLEIDPWRIASTVGLCGSLALLFGAIAIAIAGWVPRPSAVLSIGIAATVTGYVVSALFPLSDTLEPFGALSPWRWAFGGDPLGQDPEPWRFLVLAIPTVLLVGIAVAGFVRRDIRAA